MFEIDKKLLIESWQRADLTQSAEDKRLFQIILEKYISYFKLRDLCDKSLIPMHTIRKYVTGDLFPSDKTMQTITNQEI